MLVVRIKSTTLSPPIKSPRGLVKVMVFNATFNNISVISWQSSFLVEETGIPIIDKPTDLSQVTDIMLYHPAPPRISEIKVL